jgi:hypothetical protein
LVRLLRQTQVYLYSECLPEAEIRRAHLTPVTDIRATLQAMQTRAGRELRLAVLPQGPQTVPYLLPTKEIPY